MDTDRNDTGTLMWESARPTCGWVCTDCPGCILKSGCPLLSRCISQRTDERGTVSASPGPPAELRHPASGWATARPTRSSSEWTSCSGWRPRGASWGRWSRTRCSPAGCPSCFSLSRLHLEALFGPSDIWVCRNTVETITWFKCNFHQVTCSLRWENTWLQSVTRTARLFLCPFFFGC